MPLACGAAADCHGPPQCRTSPPTGLGLQAGAFPCGPCGARHWGTATPVAETAPGVSDHGRHAGMSPDGGGGCRGSAGVVRTADRRGLFRHPRMLLGSRVRGMAKVLGNLSREGALDPPLVQVVYRSLAFWNRRPREPVDVVAWRRSVEAAEAHSVPVPRLREQMVAADQGLAAWVKQHRYLVPSAVELGESGMALLVLWEVDHRHPYPGQGGDGLSAALVGFTRRLQERVGKDDELRHWLVWKDMNVPLCAGLAPSHHRRWAVRLVAPGPGEPRGWYDEFVGRWRVYLETLARPRGSRPSSTVTEDEAFRIRPRLVVEPSASTVDMGPGAPPGPSISPSGASPRVADLVGLPAKRRRLPGPRLPPPAASEPSRKRHRPSQSPEEAPPPRRQRTLTTWLQSRQANPLPAEDHGEPSPPHHGRAVEGPPT